MICEVQLKVFKFIFLLIWVFVISRLIYAQEEEIRVEFPEIWVYLLDGEERYFNASYPISDIGYFGAGLNNVGKLVGVPDPKKINSFKGKVHLVVAEVGNYALTHFCLNPAYPVRDALISDIVAAASKFDGVQIDFEVVQVKDRDNFFSFLSLLKAKLETKPLSLAIPARTSEINNDVYDYTILNKIADKIIIMAYDEHWSTSKPGSIASIDWCQNVSKYALSKIENKKLVMGVPFYGRAWADKNPAKAYKHSGIKTIISEKNITELQRKKEIPYVEYQETVNVQVYFEDAPSIIYRLNMYKNVFVNSVSFWRLGQEDPDVWKYLRLIK
jgi:spore germination protein YaaH